MRDTFLCGYHTLPFTMGLTYSRDGMARHWQILGNMLEMLLEHVLVQGKDHPVSRFGSAMMRVQRPGPH